MLRTTHAIRQFSHLFRERHTVVWRTNNIRNVKGTVIEVNVTAPQWKCQFCGREGEFTEELKFEV